MLLTYSAIAKTIDHALLLPTMTEAELAAGCRLADTYDVASVCIKPYAVPLAVEILKNSAVHVGTVVGFPHGGQSTACKLAETIEAMTLGAVEIDMVINIGAALSGNWKFVESEIAQITEDVHRRGGLIKVIYETCYLNDNQKQTLTQICGKVGVDYIKTSTGFGTGGATLADLRLMKESKPAHVLLKASGGIKDLQTAIEFVEFGCDRLGLSKTAQILDDLCRQLGLPIRDVSRETSTQIGNETY